MTDDPHQPLRDDVRLLGELLGQVLREHEGVALYDQVERVRALSKRARTESADVEELAADLATLPVESALPLARAFAHFLNLANVAEQHHRVRRRRQHRAEPDARPQRGSCEDGFARLLAAGIPPDRLHDAVSALQIELVLTAHPTEISRRTLVQKYNRIAATLAARDVPGLTEDEHAAMVAALRREVTAAWGTSEVRAEQPDVLDEVRAGLIVFEHSLWYAVPRYLAEVDRALRHHTGQGLSAGAVPIRFGSWIGGDRDGNANVTADVTRRTCLLHRWMAVELYLREIDALRDELSVQDATPALLAQAEQEGVPSRAAHEPYRALLRTVRRRLAATRAWTEESLRSGADRPIPADAYVVARDFAAVLDACDASLRATGYAVLADGRLLDLRRRVSVFGLTLARLDVRQDAARHTDALSAISTTLGEGTYQDWDESARLDFLLRELQREREPPSLAEATPEVEETLATFRMIAAQPPESLGAYVITMTSCASDVLAVALLQQYAAVEPPLRIVPLFETSRDLEHAGAILDQLLTIPWYRDRIRGHQEVMVGYSDSAKDVGRLAASWDLHRAQEAIVDACRRNGVRVTLFHGRGGSVGRGGGPTSLAIMSQPPGSIDGSIRVTEQGEMMQALFGLPDIALRTLEVYTTGMLEAWLTPAPPAPPEWRACMDQLRDAARAAFRSTVYDNPQFVPYFHAATPEAELAAMNIGSRPARRRIADADMAGVTSLRAIPWQFAWTQTRLLLGAWLGAEAALDQAMARGELDLLRRMYDGWPYFRSVIDLIEMVLAKSDARIAAEYDRRLVPPSLQPLGAELRVRLARVIAGVLQVTRHRELLESNPVLRRSIAVRNPYVDPINLVQVELLRRSRVAGPAEAGHHTAAADARHHVKAALLVTINGVAAGMRNTG